MATSNVGDLATLGLGVDDSGAVRAIGTLDRLAIAGSRTEQSLKRQTATAASLSRQYDRLSETDLANASRRFDELFGATNRVTDSTRKMTLMHAQAIKMNAELDAATVASTGSLGRFNLVALNGRAGLGRLSTAFAALAARLTGVSPILGTLAATLGGFAVGGLITAGVLAGVALLIAIWRDFGSEARAAQKEIDELSKRLQDQAANEYADTVAGATDEVVKMEGEVRRLNDEMDRGIGLWDKFKVFAFGGIGGGLKGVRGMEGDQEKAAAKAQTALDQAQRNREKIIEREAREAARIAKEAAEEAKRARALVFANEERVRLAEQELATIGVTGVLLEQMQLQHDVINQKMRLRETLTGKTLEDALAAIDAEEGIRTSIIAANDELRKRAKLYDEISAKRDKTEQQERDAAEYAKEMQAIWRQGIGKIVTDGTKSFRDFFENVLQMFSKLMAKMEAAGKDSGGMYKALGIGSAAIGGGFAGFQVGQQTGSAALGAGAGALIGNSIMPGIGAVVGGLAGFATGLLGAASAARQAAKEMALLKESVKITVLELRAQVGGSAEKLALEIQKQRTATAISANNIARTGGMTLNAGGVAAIGSGDYAKVLADIARQGGAWARQMEEVIKLAMQIEQQTKERYERERQYLTEDLQVRLLRAQGLDKEAEAMEKALRHERERADLVRSFGDEIDATEAATLALLDQVHAQEKLKKATDAANSSALNWVDGYKSLQDVIFDSMFPRSGTQTPRTPPPKPTDTTPWIPPIEIPVTLTLDGQVIARTTVSTLQGSAQRQFGDSTRWAEVQRPA